MSKVKKILYAHDVDMGGTKVKQPIPTVQVDQIDPFLLLHHHSSSIKAGSHPRDLGVGPHPHRGFSPVTFIFKGSVHHRDSRGNSSIVHAGGAQWMNAGMGMIHSERPPLELAEEGGDTEIIQLWVNTPGANKMDQPEYQAIQKADTVDIPVDKGEGSLSLISGSIGDRTGKVYSKLPVISATGELNKGAGISIDIQDGMNSFIYLLNGSLRIPGFGLVDGLNLVEFEAGTTNFEFEAVSDTRLLFMAGKPIGESVNSYGPFVMNTQTEIMEAMRDYQMGKMGILIEEF